MENSVGFQRNILPILHFRSTDIEIVENSVTKGRFVNKSQIIMGSTASTNGEKQGES